MLKAIRKQCFSEFKTSLVRVAAFVAAVPE